MMMLRPRVNNGRPLLGLVAALVALAWVTFVLWSRSPYGRFLDHEELSLGGVEGAGPYLALLGAFVAGWTLMIAAMMLPTTLPLIALFQMVISHREDRLRLTSILIAGYVAVWSAVGVLLHAADLGLHVAVESNHVLAENARLIPSAAFLAAGAYQFSSWKHFCLEKCRSPFSFVVGHWQGGGAALNALRLGLHHGLFCAGCCWLLMLLMFAFGVGNAGWMLVLGAVMAVEKNVSWGRKLTRPVGFILLVAGLALLAVHVDLSTACAHEAEAC